MNTVDVNKLNLRVNCFNDACQLVEMFHYSKRIPANIQFVASFHLNGGLFNDYGDAIAAIFFSIPPTRWKEPVIELSRLVRHDEYKLPLTKLISIACKRLKQDGYDLIVSFADASQKHHGGVYQAASWNYHGQRDSRMDGVIINNKFYPGRSCNSRWGTRSPTLLSAKLKQVVEPHFDIGKHLYWKALNKHGELKAQRLGLQRNPYPKPLKIESL